MKIKNKIDYIYIGTKNLSNPIPNEYNSNNKLMKKNNNNNNNNNSSSSSSSSS